MRYQIRHAIVKYAADTILEDVNFEIHDHEKIAIIGRNGCGKTTLLKLISGEVEMANPDSDEECGIVMAGKQRIGYLRQISFEDSSIKVEEEILKVFAPVFSCEKRMQELTEQMKTDTSEHLLKEYAALQAKMEALRGYTYRQDMETMFQRFGFALKDLQRPIGTFSGGQQTKVAFVKLLLSQPDIMLLDEPTNYLDVEHITWLKRYLEEYENAFILISHDIPFLNSVVNLIYHMENKELNRYVGDYDHFQEVYAVKKAQKEAAYNRQQQEISELKDFVARNKARVATRNMAMSRQKKLDKMDVIELAKEKPKPEFHFRTARTSGRFVVTAKELVIGYEEPLSRPLTFAIERGEKIVLTGANGIGKTTLLKSILGLIPSLGGDVELGDYLEIGYFEQEMPKGNTNSCIQEIWEEFPSYTQYEVRAALAKCGLTTQHIESLVRVLSGGEQAKVRLCKLINRETNLLVLDEPTNHLDVDAKEELKNALKEYKGTVLMVCHEPEFYDGLATSVWDCSEWTTKVI